MKINGVFFDIESTGLDTKTDRIVELSLIKIKDDAMVITMCIKVNPTIPISPEATAVHGITNEDVENCLPFSHYATEVFEFIGDNDLYTYNGLKFDIPMLFNEFERCGIVWDYHMNNLIDVGNIYKILNPRNLASAYQRYSGKVLENAHSAEADCIATFEVMQGILKSESEMPKTPKDLAKYSNYDKDILDLNGYFYQTEEGIFFNFSKHKDNLAKTEIGMLYWMIRSNFPSDTIKICRFIIEEEERIMAEHLDSLRFKLSEDDTR